MLLALLTLGGIFSDHMVLQRQRGNPIWGHDDPGQQVTLVVDGAPAVAVRTVAAADGSWRVTCPELPAGGPYRLRVQGSTEEVLEDVMVGEVWLASGQSNMEFALASAADAEREIATASFPWIRLAKIAKNAAGVPQADASTGWRVCMPEEAAAFSAVGYFFAREIHQHVGVPIGIIDATWGGTRVEAWTSREALRAVWPGAEHELAAIASAQSELPRIAEQYRQQLLAWESNAFPQDPGNAGESQGWAEPGFDDRGWREMRLPGLMQAQGAEGNGIAWFRRRLEIPPSWAGQDVQLELGAIDDFDVTYFNGEKIGATGAGLVDPHNVIRRYAVPGRLVRAGANVIAVRVYDRFGEGGLLGPGVRMNLRMPGASSAAVSLVGNWRWQIEQTFGVVPGTVYRTAPVRPAALDLQNAPAHLFNGMIAPVVSYGLRGFLWYQGESNVDGHSEYERRFRAMIRDWRTRWGLGTAPFYFVQLAGYRANGTWPYLREAQAQALTEPGTGMAVTLDIGDASDIHPKNKHDVGRRLALLARAHIYGEHRLVASGPTLRAIEIRGVSAIVRWNNAAGLHTRDQQPVRGFEIAGADGVYHPADARIKADTIELHSPRVTAPVSVRYAWADFAEVNLTNAAGLPAAPFRTDTL